jgi:hypothetical protein
MMSILNRELYDVLWLYREAQLNDEWDDTPPGEGTSVRAALEILRTKGHKDYDIPEPKREAGITEYRWASTVDEVRGLIALNIPVVIGVNWYSNFDNPVTYNGESWVGRTKNLGYIRGGHCVCIHGASDKRQAVRFLNSWGAAYPPTWLPYKKLQRLINEDGEVGLVTDFPGDPDPGDYIWKS